MRLKIYDEKVLEKPTLLKLVHCLDEGKIDLIVVDHSGREIPGGAILGIRADGTMVKYRHISTSIPLQLDKSGSIVEKSS